RRGHPRRRPDRGRVASRRRERRHRGRARARRGDGEEALPRARARPPRARQREARSDRRAPRRRRDPRRGDRRAATLPLGGCPSNHGGCGERSGGCERRARSSLLRRAFRHASSVVAALAALAPRLVRLARHDYPDRLLGVVVLGIESSCDDSAAAVLRDGRLAASVVSSQDAVHGPYGGVVPELASRQHIRNLLPVIDAALARAGADLGAIEGIAVTCGPGLVGSLLVGLTVAKGIAQRRRLPLVGVNHLEGHLLAVNLERPAADPLPFPFLGLIVSGGHTGLYLARGAGDYACLGRTRDDAVGEAFDKAARLLGLGYPGGPAIDRLAREGDPKAIRFPRATLKRGRFDF